MDIDLTGQAAAIVTEWEAKQYHSGQIADLLTRIAKEDLVRRVEEGLKTAVGRSLDAALPPGERDGLRGAEQAYTRVPAEDTKQADELRLQEAYNRGVADGLAEGRKAKPAPARNTPKTRKKKATPHGRARNPNG